jgi:hypothetical protein
MIRNTLPALFSVLLLALTLTLFSNFSFAQDEHGEESHEHETEKAAVESSEDHSSHEVGHEEEQEEAEQHEHVHEVGEGSHVHNSLTAESAQWIGVGTLVAGATVFGIKARSTNKFAYKHVVLALSVGVGIMHILLTPDHLVDVSIAHAIFFAVAGAAQIGFGLIFMIKPVRKLAIIGAIGNIGSIILYFITRLENLPQPLGAPEGIDPVGIIAKVIEMSLVAFLIYLAVYLRKPVSAKIGT